MKHIILASTLLLFCWSCAESTFNPHPDGSEKPKTLRSLLTKSADQEDSLTVMSNLQGDDDYFMMGRIIEQDSIFVLNIKKEDAIFLGISEEVYDYYLDYVPSSGTLIK